MICNDLRLTRTPNKQNSGAIDKASYSALCDSVPRKTGDRLHVWVSNTLPLGARHQLQHRPAINACKWQYIWHLHFYRTFGKSSESQSSSTMSGWRLQTANHASGLYCIVPLAFISAQTFHVKKASPASAFSCSPASLPILRASSSVKAPSRLVW